MTNTNASECVAATTRMHVSLDVSNVARSVAFYAAFLGTPPTKVRGDAYAKFTLDAPGLVLSLNGVREAPGSEGGARRGALSHLGFQVATDAELDAARRRIVDAGLEISLDEPGVTCCYAVQNKFWVQDPDGNPWEVYRFVEDAETFGASAAPVASSAAAAPCCAPTCCDATS